MTGLLVLRPQPGADATVRRARALGLDAIAAPLFIVRPVVWQPPDPSGFDALLLTSANAVRMAGENLSLYRDLPVFAVGEATARAARAAGFTKLFTGDRNGAASVAMAVARGKQRLLHLTGRDHVNLAGQGASITSHIVYASEAGNALPDLASVTIRNGAVILLHSIRAAKLFADLADAAGLDRKHIALAGLSSAICRAAGLGWAAAAAAPRPDDDALLAIAARLCDQGADKAHRPEAEDQA